MRLNAARLSPCPSERLSPRRERADILFRILLTVWHKRRRDVNSYSGIFCTCSAPAEGGPANRPLADGFAGSPSAGGQAPQALGPPASSEAQLREMWGLNR